MKKPLRLAVFVLGCLSSAQVQADNYTVSTSHGSTCSQSQTNSNKKFSVGTDFDTEKQEGTVSAKFTIALGGKKTRKIDCNRLYEISVKSEQLSLDRANLEIDLLKAQLQAIKSGKQELAPATEKLTYSDDW